MYFFFFHFYFTNYKRTCFLSTLEDGPGGVGGDNPKVGNFPLELLLEPKALVITEDVITKECLNYIDYSSPT